jgi:hypothetical protein
MTIPTYHAELNLYKNSVIVPALNIKKKSCFILKYPINNSENYKIA